MKMLKFTNASSDVYRGMPLYISSDWIASAYEEPTNSGSLKTVIWGGPTGMIWFVEESLGEVIKIIREATNEVH